MATMSSDDVTVISKVTIKPSTQTPYQLKNFNLSLLDQYNPPIYIPTILFYPADDDSVVASSTGGSKLHDNLGVLKTSLSETLVHFYPMAGRIRDNVMVDCNDQGIEFFQLRIKGEMRDFMMKRNVPLSQLLPVETVSSFVEEAQVIVQVNMFDCGGTAICLCISHKIADAYTMSAFIVSWAGITYNRACCGGGGATTNQKKILLPSFDSASLFPPSEQLASPSGMLPIMPTVFEDVRDDNTVTKRFVFDMVKIESAREKLQYLMQHNNCEYRRPTSVEVVTFLIWKSTTMFAPAGSLPIVNHAVNLRNKMDPPLQDVSFGNLYVTVTLLPAEETTAATSNKTIVDTMSNEVQVLLHELNDFAAQLRGAIGKVKGDKGCMQKLVQNYVINGSIHDHTSTTKNNVEDDAVVLWMTSWCRMGLYEVDFGWGKPIWVTTDPNIKPNRNMIFMNDTKCGQGIDVWAAFLEDDMAKFELRLTEILELI